MDLEQDGEQRDQATSPGVERIFTEREKRDLAGHSFKGDFDHVDFACANLQRARFASASLRGCDFRRADLRGAHFVACDIRDVRFEGAAFGDNRFDETLLSSVHGADELRETIERAGGFFTPEGSSYR